MVYFFPRGFTIYGDGAGRVKIQTIRATPRPYGEVETFRMQLTNNNLNTMDKKLNVSTVVGALLIGAGIFFLGLFIKGGIDNMAYRDREVTVRGLAEREVPANRVTWPITYSVAGNDLTAVYNQVTSNNNAIVKFLTANGIDKEEITIAPPDTYNATTNQYRSSNIDFKYSLNNTITVTSSKVDKVRALIDKSADLLKDGIPVSNGYIDYEYTALNDIKPEMIAEATKNAREAADRFAADSGSKVGKMKTANQGQFSIESQSSSVPFIKKVRVVSTIVYYLED